MREGEQSCSEVRWDSCYCSPGLETRSGTSSVIRTDSRFHLDLSLRNQAFPSQAMRAGPAPGNSDLGPDSAVLLSTPLLPGPKSLQPLSRLSQSRVAELSAASMLNLF